MLGLAKFWEGHEGDDILRRFVMMVAGLAIGVAAFAASDMLMVRLSTNEMFNVLDLPRDVIPNGIYASDGTPGLTPFLAYFATLFRGVCGGGVRWIPCGRRGSACGRPSCVHLVAMLIPWQIPWGFLLAMTTSVAVQLSAPWMSSSERARFRHDALEA